MKRTPIVRQAILDKYSKGQIFTSFDFDDIPGKERTSSILSIMNRTGFIEKVGTLKHFKSGYPPINRYKLAGTTHQEDNKVYLSQWHLYPTIPEHLGFYEVTYYDGKKSKTEWNGKWHLPVPYIKGWRGIAR